MPEATELDLSAPEVQAAIKAAVEKEAAGLKANRDALLKEKKEMEARLKGLPEDFDPERWVTLTKAEKDRERQAAEAKGEFAKIEEQLKKQHASELAKREAREDRLTNALYRRMVEAQLAEAIRKAGGEPDYVLHHGVPQVRVRETDDDFEAFVVLPDGKTPRMKDGQGTPFTFDDLAAELRDKYPRAFDGTGSSGSGAPSGGTSGGGAAGTIVYDANDPMALGRLTNDQVTAMREGKLRVVAR